jgi:hypothetical protein
MLSHFIGKFTTIYSQHLFTIHSAFSFYHTAYKERIDDVEKTLDVVEQLRNYRPKHPAHKSATRIPIFSGMGQHFNLLRNPAQQPSASRESSESDADDNTTGTDRFSRQRNAKKSKRAKFPWFGGPSGPPSRKGTDSSTETHEKMKSVDDDIEMGPLSNMAENPFSSSVQSLIPQGHSTANNPNTSPEPSLENHPDTIFKQATRALKNTVLHARNLRGQTERLTGWEVNSAHEAKVRHSTFYSSKRKYV